MQHTVRYCNHAKMKQIIGLLQHLIVIVCILCFSAEAYIWCGHSVKPTSVCLAAGRGFGKAIAKDIVELQPTRKSEARVVTGDFAKLLARMTKIFDTIKTDGSIADIYARSTLTDTFWFVGKVCFSKELEVIPSISSISMLIFEYAKSLRPSELAGPRSPLFELEIWHAIGDSEMNVAQNKVSLQKVDVNVADSTFVVNDKVGFQPEIYVDGEPGFRCRRDNQGRPLAPSFEVEVKDPSSIPTPDA